MAYHLPTVLPNTGPWPKEYAQLLWPLNQLTLEAPPERVAAFYREWGQANPAPSQVAMFAYMMGQLPIVPSIITAAWYQNAGPGQQPRIAVQFYLPDIFAN